MYFNSKKGTLLISFIFLVVVAIGFYGIQTFPKTTSKTLGPSYMPKVLLSGILLFVIFHIIQSLNPKTKDEKVYIGDFKLQLTIVGLTVIYLILVPLFGFYPITSVWLLILFYIFIGKKIIQSVALTVLLMLIVYGLFDKLLQVNFPRASLW